MISPSIRRSENSFSSFEASTSLALPKIALRRPIIAESAAVGAVRNDMGRAAGKME